MAELLVKATDATHDDPAKDAMCYKRGMAVVVMPDGHPWGSQEGPPDFVLIKMPGVSVEAARQYVRMQYAEEAYAPQSAKLETEAFVVVDKTGAAQLDSKGNPVMAERCVSTVPVRRRDWSFDLDALPKDAVEKGVVVMDPVKGDVAWEQMKDCLYSNRLGRTELRTDVRLVDFVP